MDRWDGFQVMSRFAQEARRSRCDANPFQMYEQDIARIEKETSALDDTFREKTNISKFLSSPISFKYDDVTIRIRNALSLDLKRDVFAAKPCSVTMLKKRLQSSKSDIVNMRMLQ